MCRSRLLLATALTASTLLLARPSDAGELSFEDVSYIKLEFMILRGQVHEAIEEGNRMLAGARPTADSVMLHQIGRVLVRLCDAYAELGQYEQAEAACLEAVATLDELRDMGDLGKEAQAEAQAMLGYTYERAGKLREAIEARRRQVELTENGPATADYRSSLLARIGDLQWAMGESDQAEASYLEAVDLTSQIPEPNGWTALAAYHSLAAFYQREERLDEAEAVLDFGIAEARHLSGTRESHVISFFEALGDTFVQQGRYADARDLAQQALDYYRREGKGESLEAADAMILMARIEDAEGPGSPEAARLLSAVLEMPEDSRDANYGRIKKALAGIALAEHRLLSGDFSGAEPLAQEAATAIAGSLGEEGIVAARAYKVVAFAMQGLGKAAEAIGFAQKAYATEQRVLPPYHSETGETLALLAELYGALGQREDLAAVERLVASHKAERAKFESSR